MSKKIIMPDIPQIIDRLTLEVKAALLTWASACATTPVMRLGVPESLVIDGQDGIGMDLSGFSMDFPLMNVFRFQEGNLPATPEQLGDTLLSQLR